MSNYCNQCDCCKYNNYQPDDIYAYNFMLEQNDECDKYKEKADEIYKKVKYIQKEAEKSIHESKELEQQARELERQAKELYIKSQIAYDDAYKLESESHNLLDLSNFYCQKVQECYKNSNYICDYNKCYENSCKCASKYKNEYNGGIISNTGCRCTSKR